MTIQSYHVSQGHCKKTIMRYTGSTADDHQLRLKLKRHKAKQNETRPSLLNPMYFGLHV